MRANNVWNVLGAITRYGIAVAACVSIAQFLLLIGVSTGRAQRLAGQAFGRAILCGAIAAWWFYKNWKRNQVNLAVDKPLQAPTASVSMREPPQIQPAETSVSAQPPQTQATSPTTREDLVPILGLVFAVLCLILFSVLFTRKQNDVAPANTRAGSLASGNPLDEALRQSPATVSPCPPAIPADTPMKVFSPQQLKRVIGTEATLDTNIASYWMPFKFRISNGTEYCISSVEVKAIFQQQEGSDIIRQSKVTFEPMLQPDHERSASFSVARYNDKEEWPSGIKEWHITKVWGFPLNPANKPTPSPK